MINRGGIDMANFNTDDDYPFYDPEDGFDVNKARKKKKQHYILSLPRFLDYLSNDSIIYLCFIVIWIIIVFNIETVLDWLFFVTFGLLQHVLLGLILFLAVYLIWKKYFR